MPCGMGLQVLLPFGQGTDCPWLTGSTQPLVLQNSDVQQGRKPKSSDSRLREGRLDPNLDLLWDIQ